MISIFFTFAPLSVALAIPIFPFRHPIHWHSPTSHAIFARKHTQYFLRQYEFTHRQPLLILLLNAKESRLRMFWIALSRLWVFLAVFLHSFRSHMHPSWQISFAEKQRQYNFKHFVFLHLHPGFSLPTNCLLSFRPTEPRLEIVRESALSGTDKRLSMFGGECESPFPPETFSKTGVVILPSRLLSSLLFFVLFWLKIGTKPLLISSVGEEEERPLCFFFFLCWFNIFDTPSKIDLECDAKPCENCLLERIGDLDEVGYGLENLVGDPTLAKEVLEWLLNSSNAKIACHILIIYKCLRF